MSQQLENRAKALFNYLQEVIKLGLKVFRTVEEHKEDFILFQNELPNDPGVSLFTTSNEDLYWLSVYRQNIPNPPELPEILEGWVEISDDPEKEPQIIKQRTFTKNGNQKIISFYEDKSREDAFIEYFERWEQWSKDVKNKKEVQALFDKLFRINERLKYDEQLELIWGYGLLLWKKDGYTIKYPLVTQRMVIEHLASEGVIHLFPEDNTEPKLELDMLRDIELPDLTDIRKKFVESLQTTEEKTSKDSSYPLSFCIPILKEIAGRLSPEGEFVKLSEIHELSPSNKLRIVDCWVLFLRKRQQDAVIRDIEAFQDKLKNGEVKLEGALLSFIRDPQEKLPQWDRREKFDEWGVVLNKQILFPLPANEEQVQILDRFEHSDGVIVWGPPGTGKSHTIANLICHFMAEGKRVLVTSQKDQALSVLHNMIPSNLRPLCMSVLSNVRDSREKLERAVATITEIVTQSQLHVLLEKIKNLEDKLDWLREELTKIERRIKELSLTQYRYIKFDDEEFLPADIIKKIKEEEKNHIWFVDSPEYEITIKNFEKKEIVHIIVNPPLSTEEIEELKTLRNQLLEYLSDLSYDLPSANELVDGIGFQKIAEDYQRISQIEKTIKEYIPTLIFKNEDEKLFDEALKVLKDTLNTYKLITENWQYSLLSEFRKGTLEINKIKQAIEKLNTKTNELTKLYQTIDPLQVITLPETFSLEEQKTYVEQALDCLKKGKRIFRFLEFNRKKKAILKSILINGKSPDSIEEWEAILNYIRFLTIIKELKLRWNNFAKNINAPQLSKNETPEQDAKELLFLIKKLDALLNYETIYLPKTRQILSSLIVNADKIVTDASLEKIYNALKLRKEIKNFQSSKYLREKLKNNLQRIIAKGKPHPIVKELLEYLEDIYNKENIKNWEKAYLRVKNLESIKPQYNRFKELINKLSKQAPKWAEKWIEKNISEEELCPPYWRRSWWFQALRKYIQDISNGTKEIYKLEKRQNQLMDEIKRTKRELVLAKVKLSLTQSLTEAQLMALKRWYLAVKKLGKGKGKYTWQKEKLVQKEMKKAKDAVPVWIMPLYRVSETIPSEFGSFDVIIIDEASQCDIRALLALARGKKAIIVGDPEQISPEGVGINREEIQKLIKMYLSEIPNKDYFDLETSLYDLANIVFSGQGMLMLKEHFRCVPEIIEFSNKLCYHGEILPLRNPPSNERLEPVLESVFVEGGYREGRADVNKPEARAICERVRQIVNDPKYKGKSIGVISLLGKDQARYIFNIIGEYITPEQQEEYKFRVGDSYDFQGDERDIILLSMVVGANDEKRLTTLSYDIKRYRQRFNVAVSRAREKLILFHSIKLENLKPNDLRYQLLYYIQNKTLPDEIEIEKKVDTKFESPFEEKVYHWLTSRGYRVTPQVKVGHYRIDLVVEGTNSRLGIECDGDRWHPPEKWWEDQIRQRQLERMGWTICRIWGSDFYRDPDAAMEPVLHMLNKLGITPSRFFASNFDSMKDIDTTSNNTR